MEVYLLKWDLLFAVLGDIQPASHTHIHTQTDRHSFKIVLYSYMYIGFIKEHQWYFEISETSEISPTPSASTTPSVPGMLVYFSPTTCTNMDISNVCIKSYSLIDNK